MADRSVPVIDVLSRLAAGEDLADVAYDYDIPRADVEALRQVA